MSLPPFAIILHLLIIACMMLAAKCFGGDTVTPSAHRSLRKYGTSVHAHGHAPRVMTVDIKDKITELQCNAMCEQKLTAAAAVTMTMTMTGYHGDSNDNNGSPRYEKAFAKCRDQCRIDARKQPRRGVCPSVEHTIFKNITPREDEFSCVYKCNYDFDCPGVRKCCQSECGLICRSPIGVRDDKLLPAIPRIMRTKPPHGHKVEITIESAMNVTCYFHVEARSHIGTIFSLRKLNQSAWHWQPVEKTAEILVPPLKKTNVAFSVKPGSWYQLRVAAINAYGFRGYSEPTKAFALSQTPKPPKPPAGLKVVSATLDGGFFKVKIVWCPSKSTLPVEKYKVTCSLYIQSKGNSLISSEYFVKNGEQFEIPNLLPDSSYYIQVQAISINGRSRLKSQTTPILYNTTTVAKTKRSTESYTPLRCSNGRRRYSNKHRQQMNDETTNTQEQPFNDATTNKIQSSTTISNKTAYQIRYLMNRKLGMIVQISGFYPQKEKVYELCPKETNCKHREYSAIRVKKNSLDFSKLKYNTTYIFKAFRSEKNDNSGGSSKPIEFTTPKCEKFSRKFPKMQIKC